MSTRNRVRQAVATAGATMLPVIGGSLLGVAVAAATLAVTGLGPVIA